MSLFILAIRNQKNIISNRIREKHLIVIMNGGTIRDNPRRNAVRLC